MGRVNYAAILFNKVYHELAPQYYPFHNDQKASVRVYPESYGKVSTTEKYRQPNLEELRRAVADFHPLNLEGNHFNH